MRLLNGPAPLGDISSIVAAGVHFVGNAMIDTLEGVRPQARGGEVLEHMRLSAQRYGLGSRRPPSSMCSPGATQRSSSDSSARPAKLSQQARLEWPVAMDWHRESDGTAVLAVDVVAAVNAEEQPAVPLERLCQNAPGR